MKTMSAIKTNEGLHNLTVILLAILLIVLHIRLYQYSFDDAFIHFRVARNLFETGTPYFNINEAVKVSTSSAWVIFLAILLSISRLFKFDSSFPMFVSIVNALVTLGGLLVYAKIIKKLSKVRPSFLTTFLFYVSYTALVIPSSIGLMETSFALFIAGLGIYCLLLSKREGFTLLAFSVYIRLEFAVILILAIILGVLLKNMPLKDILTFSGLGLTPFLIYDLYSFHTFIPHSIVAKSIVYLTTWEQTGGNIIFFSLPTISGLKNDVFLAGTGILFLSALLLTSQGAFREWKRYGNFWPSIFWAWAILIIAGYIFGHAFMFDWYIPLYAVPILVAVFLCTNDAEYPQNIALKGVLYLLFLISCISISQTVSASIYNPETFSLFAGGSRVKTYLRIGEILYEDYPNATLLSPEIGGLGYSFKGKVFDALGLASPEALNFHPMKEPGSIPPEYVKEIMPDLIISYDIFAQALLNNEAIDQYNTVLIPAYLPDDALYSEDKTIFGSEYLRIYIRKNLAISKRLLELGKK